MVEATLTYSDREALRRKDFAELEAEELETIRRFLAQLAWQIGERKTRRYQAGGGRRLDLRRHAAAQPALRRRGAGLAAQSRSRPGRGRWSSWRTSADRWSATRACCCILPTA